MKFNKYHKIRQFKDIVRDIQFQSNFKGLDEAGEPIYEEKEKPILKFTGTVKLHGTNAGITYTPKEGIKAMKRSQLIGTEVLNAHFGFNQFVQVEHREFFTDYLSDLYQQYCKEGDQITLFGEWAGKGVQKNVGISYLNKAFYIFGCKVRNIETEEDTWINTNGWLFKGENIFNIYDFPTYEATIDFNKPALSSKILSKFTQEVEEDCPVARQRLGMGFDKPLVGEGIVWTCFWKGDKYIFKVKGEKHSTSKVKTLASVDPEVLNSIYAFVDYACTENRILQGIKEIGAETRVDTPSLLRWVANDIISEETEELKANNLEWKQVAKEVSNRTRQIFFKELDEFN